MICPKCKKNNIGYSALSSADNHTKICTICKETEIIAEYLLEDKIKIKANELSRFEKKVRYMVASVRKNIKPYMGDTILIRDMILQIQSEIISKECNK